MGLQSNGPISLNDVAGEFGGSTPHSLNEYYGVASGVPTSGAISLADFYGTSSRPIGFIDFSDPTNSNLTVPNVSDHLQRWETDFEDAYSEFSGGNHPVDAVVVNKGGTNYLIVMTGNYGAGNSYPKDMNPMLQANMVMCNIDAHPDLDVWTRVNGQALRWFPSNWYIYDPANGYDADGNAVPSDRTLRNTQRFSRLVVCKVNNAATVWQPDRDNYYGQGIYRDYVNSPSEAPHSGYWGLVPNDPINNGSGSFRTQGYVEEYESSETSTIVITKVHSRYLTRGEDSLNKVLRTTDGYNYSVSGMSAFPNQAVNYLDENEEVDNHYWRPRTIAYGNGVWVIGRDNPSITHGSGGFGDQDTRYSIIHSTDDGLTWNISNSITTPYDHYLATGENGYRLGDIWAIEFGNGVFLATGSTGLHRSTDGINWTLLSPTWSGTYYSDNWGYERSFTHDLTAALATNLSYGNGMFIMYYYSYVRYVRIAGSNHTLYPLYLYSTDNGETWTSPKSASELSSAGNWGPTAPEHLRFVEGADIFLGATHHYVAHSHDDSVNDRLVGMYRLE